MRINTTLLGLLGATVAINGAFAQQTGPTNEIAPEESLAGCMTNLGHCPSQPCNGSDTDNIIFLKGESIAYCPNGFHQDAGSPSIPCHVEAVEGLRGKSAIQIFFLVIASEPREINKTGLTPIGSTLARVRTNDISSGPCNALFMIGSNLDRGAYDSLTTSGTTATCEQPIHCTEDFTLIPANSSVAQPGNFVNTTNTSHHQSSPDQGTTSEITKTPTPSSDTKTSSGEISSVSRLLIMLLSSATGIYYSV